MLCRSCLQRMICPNRCPEVQVHIDARSVCLNRLWCRQAGTETLMSESVRTTEVPLARQVEAYLGWKLSELPARTACSDASEGLASC